MRLPIVIHDQNFAPNMLYVNTHDTDIQSGSAVNQRRHDMTLSRDNLSTQRKRKDRLLGNSLAVF